MTKLTKSSATFIDSVDTYNSGGHCMIDVIKMHNGITLTLTDESIIIWPAGADIDGDDMTGTTVAELPVCLD